VRDEIVAEIRDELNVKQFEVVASLEGLMAYRVVPNFRALGPRLGKLLPQVKERLAGLDGATVRRALEETGRFELEVDDTVVALEAGDVEIRAEQHENLELSQVGRHAVALDLTLDDNLRAEGRAREVIRTINDQRKAHGFELADRITVLLQAPDPLAAAASRHAAWIAGEVLATRFDVSGETPEVPDAVIDGLPVAVKLTRA